ncbi:MAG: hypothetical protein INR69_22820 [Mucilaginibacter polytrichastri]|nr:hypothetical protein [Mucilaginibacter polytrichastri]
MTIGIHLAAFLFLFGCKPKGDSSFLVARYNEKTSDYAYYDQQGEKVLGGYYAVYTDTIRTYGIVADSVFALIDKSGKHIYNIFPFDNGPDPTSEGIYRIRKNGKIGYADSASSRVLIEPKFGCAFPFENGKAKVAYDCQEKPASDTPGEEHKVWVSNSWFYVDKTGKKID